MTQAAPTAAAFLGVENSLSGRIWRPRLDFGRMAEAIAQRYGLPDILGRVLAARGVPMEAVEAFLAPTLRDLMPRPEALNDMEKGARRIADAVVKGEVIGIIGDYDVDGVSSTALAVRILRAVGATVHVHIPDRILEGYGPSRAAVASLHGKGARLLITLDCGVMAHDPLLHARELGMETVIVDHHQAEAELPEAEAVINPNRLDDVSGFGYLCAAGVALILCAVLLKELRGRGWFADGREAPDLLANLDLVALATVCDVVPLTGLNRAFVTQGLKVMAGRSTVGLAALADAARLKRRPDPYALGFLLGPRLNAAGRVGNAMLALDLLLTGDRGRANEIAAELEQLNRERQLIELRVVEEAAAQAEAALGKEGRLPVIIVAGEGWHPGVLGLVSARLKERFQLPAIALGYGQAGALASGSGRSVAGVDLGAAVRAAKDAGIIVKGGGHAMAAGLTVDVARLGDLRGFLEERLASSLASAAERRVLAIDGALTASGCKADLVELLERAGPFGSGNPHPVFALPAHRIAWADGAGADHVRCQLEGADGSRIKAIAFRALRTPLGERLLGRDAPLHVAGRIGIDDWGGSKQVQFMIEDAAEIPQPR